MSVLTGAYSKYPNAIAICQAHWFADFQSVNEPHRVVDNLLQTLAKIFSLLLEFISSDLS